MYGECHGTKCTFNAFYSKGAIKYLDSWYTHDQILLCCAPYVLDMSLSFMSLILDPE